jgi:hypothetical protein
MSDDLGDVDVSEVADGDGWDFGRNSRALHSTAGGERSHGRHYSSHIALLCTDGSQSLSLKATSVKYLDLILVGKELQRRSPSIVDGYVESNQVAVGIESQFSVHATPHVFRGVR